MKIPATFNTKVHIPTSNGDRNFEISIDNPELMRWFFNPASQGVLVPSRETGLQEAMVPFGVPIALYSFKTPVENCTTDEKKPREIMEITTARTAADRITDALTQRMPNGETFGKGGRVFWINERDEELVARYWAVVIPSLSDIGVQCPAMDSEDFGEREYCAQCIYDWLSENLNIEGVTLDYQAYSERLATACELGLVEPNRAEDLRKILLGGIKEYLQTTQREWTDIVTDYSDKEGGQKKLTSQHHWLRKNVHAPHPQDREAMTAARYGAAQGAETAMILKDVLQNANGGNSNEVMGKFADALKILAERLPAPPTETPAAAAPAEAQTGTGNGRGRGNRS